jgi:SAM-dependent methyltransferase
MEAMRLTEALLERTLVYRLWQAPFASQKFRPVLVHNELTRVRHVLDVGCGPGTNSKQFAHTRYLGIDINERYIEAARRRYALDFIAADACTYRTAPADFFDFILVNSFLHHLGTDQVVELLSHLRTLLTNEGHIHILEPVLSSPRSIAYLLARADRGKFVRRLDEWKSIFTNLFDTVVFEPYPLNGAGVTLWNMLYFKGSARGPV